MHVGLGLLRLGPEAFWRMTPREFAAACGSGPAGRSVLSRAGFEALVERYPDGGSP